MLDIRTLGEGEKISEPGFYRMPIERHHSQPCDGVSVTSGILRKMELSTPADVWAFHQLNPNRYTRKETDALLMGRAMASYVEAGIDELTARFWVLPSDKPSRPTAAQIRAISEGRGTDAGLRSMKFWHEVSKDPREPLDQSQWDLIVAMGEVVRTDPAAQAALGGVPEITMAWFDEVNRLWCLARPDQLTLSGMLSDYKKVNTQGRPFSQAICDQRITQHGYDMQMGFAAEGFLELTKEFPDEVGLVFQWDEAPYHVILTSIDEQDLRIAMWRNRRQRARFRECLDAEHWPGPGEHVMAYRRPAWQSEQLFEEMAKTGYTP